MDITELVNQCELESIRCFELHGHLKDYSDDESTQAQSTTDEVKLSLDVHPRRVDSEGIETWFRMTVDSPVLVASAACNAAFSRTANPGDGALEDALLAEFVERVAVMSAYPYLRAQIARLVSDMDCPMPTLPLLRAGQFKMPPAVDTE